MTRKVITQKDILYLSISLFVVVAAWIVFSLYHSYVDSTINSDLQMKITPIDPSFDTTTIDGLKTRKKVAPLFQSSSDQTASPSTTPTPTPSEELAVPEIDNSNASPSGDITPEIVP